jgi:hypothetical protein
MDYLSGKLSEKDKHEVEVWMSENEFVEEAVEGLQNFPSVQQVSHDVKLLNKDLQKLLKQKKHRKIRRTIFDNQWTLFTLVTLLILIVIAYLIIHNLRNGNH